MRASVGLFVVLAPVAGLLVSTSLAPPHEVMTVTDVGASEPSLVPGTRAPCELAAPTRWVRGTGEISATATTGEPPKDWLEEIAMRSSPGADRPEESKRRDERAGVAVGAAAPPLRLHYSDVKDLAPKMTDFRGDGFFLSPSGYTPPEPPELDEEAPVFPADPLVERIRVEVDPASWMVEGAVLDLKNGTLIVKNTPTTIEHVGRFLEKLRATTRPPADVARPPMRPEPLHLWDRAWSVVDLVGHASGDGTIEPGDGSATLPVYAPAALVALLRLNVESDLKEHPEASIKLVAGNLRVHLNWDAIVRLERLLGELRARAQPAPDADDCEVTFG
jgi:hypothetical protein